MSDLSILDGIRSRISGRPFNLEFAITRRCNSRCLMCDQWQLQTSDDLTLTEIDQIFRSYSGFKIVGITGGEPSLREDLPQLVDIILRTQPRLKRLFITTNGFLTGKIRDQARRILTSAAARASRPKITFLVSIDGPRLIHNHVRGREFAYQDAVETLRALADLRDMQDPSHDWVSVGSVTTYGPANYMDYGAVLDTVENLARTFDLDPAFCLVWFGNLYDRNLPDVQDPLYLRALQAWGPRIADLLDRYGRSHLENARALFWRLGARAALSDPFDARLIPCGGACGRYFMDNRGQIFPCVVWNKTCGSLRALNYDWRQIFKSNERRETRREIQAGNCPHCMVACEFIPSLMAYPEKTLWKVLF